MASLRIGSIVKYALLILVSLLFLTPIYVIIVTSIKPLDRGFAFTNVGIANSD